MGGPADGGPVHFAVADGDSVKTRTSRLRRNPVLIAHWRRCAPQTYWRFTAPAPFLAAAATFLAFVVYGIGTAPLYRVLGLSGRFESVLNTVVLVAIIGFSIGITLRMKEAALRAFCQAMLADDHPLICPRCGYSRRELGGVRCPECGAEPTDTVLGYGR